MEPTRDARDAARCSARDDLLDDGLIAALSALVSQAGHAIIEVARGPLGVTEKADHSPVTAADQAAQDVILSGLARLLPGVPVVSEESDDNAGRDFGDAPFVLVDPLDGTREFVAGNGDYAVNIALVQNRRPVAGVVFVPRSGVLYRGRVGHGAERVALPAGAQDGAAVPIRTRRPPADGLVAAVSRSHLDPESDRFLVAHGVVARIPRGSALKFGLLAEGTADVYPRFAPVREWDVAAGDAVLAAAGGAVLRPDGTPLLYGDGPGGFLVSGFVAWGAPPPPDR
ncbi:3'(2'),5'-bisphosphate nucleotidase CysQ [Rhodoplanes elegans]|uniref:3'(2'),5'-bisphosphate nucleotidase CysQ n=1 Tax=Rhodoplanes elegans TaxID=29408 RepID=A0A327K882_9BRAD|nr:3'(2'),5'-bisphosphate nucleotidase CysQ [Rhodoplanes elegans]MBK5957969.1 3'(2'),5'-bisphosphate nucleotidase CysQ [Rhodoplanes elegans]RAI33592.1 3'(2'),5'-bisphosphate nucleotidase CysQ [Rhodoplanes elegans]